MTNIKVDFTIPKEINALVDKQLKKDLQKAKTLANRSIEQKEQWKAKCEELSRENTKLNRKLRFYDKLRDYFKEMLADEDGSGYIDG